LPVTAVVSYNEELGGVSLSSLHIISTDQLMITVEQANLLNVVHLGSLESGMILIKLFTGLKPLV
jgi:hypothetical protein